MSSLEGIKLGSRSSLCELPPSTEKKQPKITTFFRKAATKFDPPPQIQDRKPFIIGDMQPRGSAYLGGNESNDLDGEISFDEFTTEQIEKSRGSFTPYSAFSGRTSTDSIYSGGRLEPLTPQSRQGTQTPFSDRTSVDLMSPQSRSSESQTPLFGRASVDVRPQSRLDPLRPKDPEPVTGSKTPTASLFLKIFPKKDEQPHSLLLDSEPHGFGDSTPPPLNRQTGERGKAFLTPIPSKKPGQQFEGTNFKPRVLPRISTESNLSAVSCSAGAASFGFSLISKAPGILGSGSDAVGNIADFAGAVKEGNYAEAGCIAVKSAGDTMGLTTTSMSMTGTAIASGALLAGPIVTAVGLGAMTIYQGTQTYREFEFHTECVDAIKNSRMQKFLIEHLTLNREESALPIDEQQKLLQAKKDIFEKRTNDKILEKALKALGNFRSISKEELIELASEIEHQSFENGVRSSINTSLSGLNTVGAALAIPTHGISLVVSGGMTLIYIIANRNDNVVKKITSHFWDQTEIGKTGGYIFKHMLIEADETGTPRLMDVKDLELETVFSFASRLQSASE